ncbi:MAG: hypothetical protein P4L03_05275 [Terracidiphilus sp.]|nr:hypothetical protein [Terracidiphilus sp.]
MRFVAGLVGVAVLAATGTVAAAQTQAAKPAAKNAVSVAVPPGPKALLPEAFAGWVSGAAPKPLADANGADAANAAALKEYSYTTGATATYKRDGETLTVRALRFQDASGAYGAYSFYRQNNWPKEEIGNGATSFHNRVLFWKGTTVVDATFSKIEPMSGSELRELANKIPTPSGTRATMPPILANLPQQHMDGQTTHYAEGPAGYVGAGGVLPPELVGFDRGAEAVTANYKLSSGPATLTIIDYPTPQIAEAMETRLRAYIKAGSQAQPAWPQPLKDSDVASLEARRSGPLVILVSGDAIPKDSHNLLETVHYAADFTTLPNVGGETETTKTAKLLMGIAALVIVGCSAALLLGFFLGGGRALYRIARGKPASSVFDEEFIRIDLRMDPVQEQPESGEAIDKPHLKG